MADVTYPKLGKKFPNCRISIFGIFYFR